MRKITYLILLVIPFYLAGCKKKTQAQIDQEVITSYISSHHLTATLEPNGVYFAPISGGNGSYATTATIASVTYKGVLTNDSIFDQQTSTYTFHLDEIIPGLQEGISLMQHGQTAVILVPSAYGYGAATEPGTNGHATIPPNSVLIFTINLISFQ